MSKVIRVGRCAEGNVFCKIEYDSVKDELSIAGVIGPKANGDARGSCGQIVMSPWHITEYAPNWTPQLEQRFREVWDEWHLNGMRTGSPAQRAYLKSNPIDDRLNHYEIACERLTAAGLNPDPGYSHEGKPYKYGHAWLSEPVPKEVLAFLESLPETDLTPAWV